MIQGFDFIDKERTFTCSAEKTHAMANEVWWWFRVSTDDRQRYASFRAASSDTQKSVKARIVAFYDDLLVRRATPTIPAWRRGPQQPAAAATTPAKAPEPAPAKPAAKVPAQKSTTKRPTAKKPAAKSDKKTKARSK